MSTVRKLGKGRLLRWIAAAAVLAVLVIVALPLLSGSPSPLSLARLSDTELLEVREQRLHTEGGEISGCLAMIPMPVVVGDSDAVVYAEIQNVQLDRTRLITSLSAPRLSANRYPWHIEVTLGVLDSRPSGMERNLKLNGQGSYLWKKGARVMLALKQNGDALEPVWGLDAQGTYWVRDEQGSEKVILDGFSNTLSPEEAWGALSDTWIILHGTDTERTANIAKHLARLASVKIEDANVSAAVLAVAEGQPLPSGPLLELLRRNTTDKAAPNDLEMVNTGRVLIHVLRLLSAGATEDEENTAFELLTANPERVTKWCTFCEGFPRELISLALKYGGPARTQRVIKLLAPESGQSIISYDYQASSLLLATPGADIDIALESLQSGYPSIANRVQELRDQRNRALVLAAQDHNEIVRNLIDLQRQGKGVMAALQSHAQPGDVSVLPLLHEIDIRDASYTLWLKLPDPSFIPALRDAVGTQQSFQPVLEALAACGAPDEATHLALAALQADPDTDSMESFEKQVGALVAAIQYLGRAGKGQAELRALLAPSNLAQWHRAHELVFASYYAGLEPQMQELQSFRAPSTAPYAHRLRIAALLALTRTHDPDVRSDWQAMLDSAAVTDKLTASAALFYLEDPAGNDIAELFRTHREREWPEYNEHLRSQGWTAEFQHAANYLRGQRLDSLMLDRLRAGIEPDDHDYAGNPEIVQDLAQDLLPLLVNQLDGETSRTRQEADHLLSRLLGSEVGWNNNALRGAQPEAIARRTAQVDSYLAAWKPAATLRAANSS